MKLKFVSLLGDTSPCGINGVYTLPISLGIQTIVQVIIVKINIGLASTDCTWIMLGHYLPVRTLHCIYTTPFTW